MANLADKDEPRCAEIEEPSEAASPEQIRGACSPDPMAKGRFAPTPSGRMHLGNVYAMLMAWLGAKSVGGKMVLRIEDLDPATQTGPWAQMLMQDLDWLGLDWDSGPFYQRDHMDLYEDALRKLDAEDLLYPCFCTRAQLHAATAPHASDGTPVYAGTCKGLSAEEVAERRLERAAATRLSVPGPGNPLGTISFDDDVFGRVEQTLASECGDFLVRRSDGVFAYQLAVAVDDADMGITQVVRGCDLLGSTPRQIYIRRLLGYEANVEWAHIPMMMSDDGKRLSKRDHAAGMDELKERFCRPEELIGFVAYLGGLRPSPDPASAEELAREFSWELVRARVEKAGTEIEVCDELS